MLSKKGHKLHTVKRRLSHIISNKLCNGCGTCVGMCPTSSLALERNSNGTYSLSLNTNTCSDCGFCTRVCPVLNSNSFKTFGHDISYNMKRNQLIGDYLAIYTGHATDERLRYSATSGGAITSVLNYALEEGIIDGALVAAFSEDSPTIAQPVVVTDTKGLIAASGSKYQPVPMNILLKTIRELSGRFAVVGLPCHIRGVRTAEIVDKGLREKIAFHLGIACSHNMTIEATNCLIRRSGMREEQVTDLHYRGDGWPSGIRISTEDKVSFYHNFHSIWQTLFWGFWFVPTYCLYCSDHMNELSDISFADAWLRRFLDDERNTGESIMVVRTPEGSQLLETCIERNILACSESNRRDVIESQLLPLYFKKGAINALVKFRGLTLRDSDAYKAYLKSIQEVNSKIPIAPVDFLVSLLAYANTRLSRLGFFRAVLCHIPESLLNRATKVLRRSMTSGVRNFKQSLENV